MAKMLFRIATNSNNAHPSDKAALFFDDNDDNHDNKNNATLNETFVQSFAAVNEKGDGMLTETPAMALPPR